MGAFADTYPETRLQILLDDREYDLLKLEAECAIRLWAATHADLIQRKLLEVRVSLYASAGYLQKHGTPKKVEDLVVIADPERRFAYSPYQCVHDVFLCTECTAPCYRGPM
mgnify:CR=1 FL=1